MAGLFITMGLGFVTAIIILFIEHVLFIWMVPYWRSLPEHSFLKSSIMLFISQRLYRTIHSERLIQPTEYTREMLAIVKNREFAKIFQKENISKPLPPSRLDSLSRINIYDISSEMLKLRHQSNSDEDYHQQRHPLQRMNRVEIDDFVLTDYEQSLLSLEFEPDNRAIPSPKLLDNTNSELHFRRKQLDSHSDATITLPTSNSNVAIMSELAGASQLKLQNYIRTADENFNVDEKMKRQYNTFKEKVSMWKEKQQMLLATDGSSTSGCAENGSE